MKILEQIQEWDTSMLVFINRSIENGFFDALLPLWREKTTWIPLYILIFVISILKWKRKAIPWLILFAAAVAMGDIVSSHIIKPYFARVRPCADASVFPLITLRAPYCGGNGSFTSSHATNHGIIAFYIILTLGHHLRSWRWMILLWAFMIGFAQIYVGVHYPTDILGGCLLGFLIALIFSYVWKRFFRKKNHSPFLKKQKQ